MMPAPATTYDGMYAHDRARVILHTARQRVIMYERERPVTTYIRNNMHAIEMKRHRDLMPSSLHVCGAPTAHIADTENKQGCVDDPDQTVLPCASERSTSELATHSTTQEKCSRSLVHQCGASSPNVYDTESNSSVVDSSVLPARASGQSNSIPLSEAQLRPKTELCSVNQSEHREDTHGVFARVALCDVFVYGQYSTSMSLELQCPLRSIASVEIQLPVSRCNASSGARAAVSASANREPLHIHATRTGTLSPMSADDEPTYKRRKCVAARAPTTFLPHCVRLVRLPKALTLLRSCAPSLDMFRSGEHWFNSAFSISSANRCTCAICGERKSSVDLATISIMALPNANLLSADAYIARPSNAHVRSAVLGDLAHPEIREQWFESARTGLLLNKNGVHENCITACTECYRQLEYSKVPQTAIANDLWNPQLRSL